MGSSSGSLDCESVYEYGIKCNVCSKDGTGLISFSPSFPSLFAVLLPVISIWELTFWIVGVVGGWLLE